MSFFSVNIKELVKTHLLNTTDIIAPGTCTSTSGTFAVYQRVRSAIRQALHIGSSGGRNATIKHN